MNSAPVSILIPCYNAERWVAQAIQSALDQTWQDKEVIVVDDGSTDNSLRIIKSFGARIRWETGPNRGGNAARNRLLELAQGEWLQYLDADDYLQPEKIALQASFFDQNLPTDLIYSDVLAEHWSKNAVRIERCPIPQPHDPWILLVRWYLPQTGGSLWRKQAITDVGGWKPDQSCCQEHELYLRLLMAKRRFSYCEETGAVYRFWSDATTSRRNVSEVHRRRVEIIGRAESYLQDQGLITKERFDAINQARFEVARGSWSYNPDFAESLARKIHSADTSFVPDGQTVSPYYRLLWRFLGFGAAERIAVWRRKLAAKVPSWTIPFLGS